MTYIEFFDTEASENIIGCLALVPDRVIYIGQSSKKMKRHIKNYRRVFEERGEEIEFLYRTVAKNDLEGAIEVITEIVDTYGECTVDITGGDELLCLATGIVMERKPDKDIKITKYNLRTNAVYDCIKGMSEMCENTPSLTVEELVILNGGDVVYGKADEESRTYLWELDDEFVTDVDLMWCCCKRDFRLWNCQIGVFDAVISKGRTEEDGLTVTASIMAVNSHLKKYNTSYAVYPEVKSFLMKYGLVTLFDDRDGKTVKIRFKNEQIKRCLSKAGTALEMKVFITAGGVCDGDGEFIYTDAMNGVVIDWDGEYHDETGEDVYDTENEIDVMLMKNTIPVFISCKNGNFTSDELYKLSTVTDRFSGKYGKKVLVTTALSSMGEAANYIRQRAADMEIRIIEDVHLLSDEALEKKFSTLWQC